MTRIVAGLAATVALLGARPALVAADGTAPAPTYRWVDPPAFFATGNVEPTATSTTIALGRDGSAPTGIATADGQFVVSLGGGAIAPRGDAHEVAVKVTPVDPAGLARVPAGLRANGNAYRITMTYEPSHVVVARLAAPGTLVLTVPEVGGRLFTSAAGKGWAGVDAEAVPPRQLSLSATFAAPGYYLAATNLPELVAPGHGSSEHALALELAAAMLALLLVAVGVWLARRRARHRADRSGVGPDLT